MPGRFPTATLLVDRVLASTLRVIIIKGHTLEAQPVSRGSSRSPSPTSVLGGRQSLPIWKGAIEVSNKRKGAHAAPIRTHARMQRTHTKSQTRARYANTVSQTVNNPNRAGRPSSWPELPFFFRQRKQKRTWKKHGGPTRALNP